MITWQTATAMFRGQHVGDLSACELLEAREWSHEQIRRGIYGVYHAIPFAVAVEMECQERGFEPFDLRTLLQ